jgi:hypothetical protein
MKTDHSSSRPSADALSLEASAASARQAFVCSYSSSAEFEAETIAARRAAGAYGPRVQAQTAMMVFAVVASAVLILAALSQV